MTAAELLQLIEEGHETQRVEFKSGGARSDEHLFTKVARAMIAMANTRGGGFVIVGVGQSSDGSLEPMGVTAEAESSWLDFDALSGSLSGYTYTSLSFRCEAVPASVAGEERRFVVLDVEEFNEIPVMCKKTSPEAPAMGHPKGKEVLRRGAIYVRSRRKPESCALETEEDLRALISLATDNAARRWKELGEIVAADQPGAQVSPERSVYDEELGDL